MSNCAVDRNGKALLPRQRVRVHQDEGPPRDAVVVDVFPGNPTVNEKGCWVDIDAGDGVEGMMSYILEAI